jgi:hypothetical protein
MRETPTHQAFARTHTGLASAKRALPPSRGPWVPMNVVRLLKSAHGRPEPISEQDVNHEEGHTHSSTVLLLVL